MFATSDPLSISLTMTLAGVGLPWDEITVADDSDASYKRALEILTCAGYVDAKVLLTVEMQGRLGRPTATYHCHGACDVLLNDEAAEHVFNNPEWLSNGKPVVDSRRQIMAAITPSRITCSGPFLAK